MKGVKLLFGILPFLLIAAVLLCLVLYPKPSASAQKQEIAEIWNIDTFEGGKGSRTAFLNRVARRVEAEEPSFRYLVASYTEEGARAAFEIGKFPCVLSFGIGFPEAEKYALPLDLSFEGGETDRGTVAYPWCRGEYLLFSLQEDFSEAGSTVISRGGDNCALLASKLFGISGEEKPSSEAYTSFLSGKYRYLLGTQRDRCRLLSRGVTFFERPLPAYNDLYQCVSLFKKSKAAQIFLEELLSERTREELGNIGMLPFDGEEGTRTLPLFWGREELFALEERARSESDLKFLDKVLKTV